MSGPIKSCAYSVEINLVGQFLVSLSLFLSAIQRVDDVLILPAQRLNPLIGQMRQVNCAVTARLVFLLPGGLFILQPPPVSTTYRNIAYVVVIMPPPPVPVGADGFFIGRGDAAATDAGCRGGAGLQQQRTKEKRVTSTNGENDATIIPLYPVPNIRHISWRETDSVNPVRLQVIDISGQRLFPVAMSLNGSGIMKWCLIKGVLMGGCYDGEFSDRKA